MTDPDWVAEDPDDPGRGYDRRDPGRVLPDGVPKRDSRLGEVIAWLEDHLTVNESMAKLAGKKRNILDKPNWQRMVRPTAARITASIDLVPTKTFVPDPGLRGDDIGRPGENFPPGLTDFVARRDAYVRQLQATMEVDLDSVQESAEQVAAQIATFGEKYEWVRQLAGGQQLLDDGKRLQQQTARIFPLFVKLNGTVLGYATKATTAAELVQAQAELQRTQDAYRQYNDVLNAVIDDVKQIIDDEKWKAILAGEPRSPIKMGVIEFTAAVLSGAVTAAKKASPVIWGVGTAGGGVQLGITAVKNKLLQYVRDADIKELKEKIAREGGDVDQYAYDMLENDLLLMPGRVLDVQKERTEIILATIGVPLSEFSTVWDVLRPALAGAVNGYYEARVAKLKALLRKQGLVRERNGVLEAMREWGEEAGEHLKEEVGKTLGEGVVSGVVAVLAKAGKDAIKAVAEFCEVDVPDLVVEGAKTLLRNLVIALCAKIVSMIAERLPIQMAQVVTGEMIRDMEDQLEFYRNYLSDMVS